MKAKLLKQIDFSSVKCLSDKQLLDLRGGGTPALRQGLVNLIYDWINEHVHIGNNCKCS